MLLYTEPLGELKICLTCLVVEVNQQPQLWSFDWLTIIALKMEHIDKKSICPRYYYLLFVLCCIW